MDIDQILPPCLHGVVPDVHFEPDGDFRRVDRSRARLPEIQFSASPAE